VVARQSVTDNINLSVSESNWSMASLCLLTLKSELLCFKNNNNEYQLLSIIRRLSGETCTFKLFSDINVSQGSVATFVWCGGIFNADCIANLLTSQPVKEL